MKVDFCQKCQKQVLFLRFRDFVSRVTKPNSYNIYIRVLIFIDMKEVLKSVLDVESGLKNLSEEQVKLQFQPFVESVARRQKFSGNPLPMEELIPLGEKGLLEAWRQYDPKSGCKFVPYAVWFVRKAMERRLQ